MEIVISDINAVLIFTSICFFTIVIAFVQNYNYTNGYNDAMKEINSISNHLIDKK